MKTTNKDEINCLINSKLYTLLIECINEQYKKHETLNEMNYFKASLFTSITNNDCLIDQYDNNSINSNYIETLTKLVIFKRNRVLDSLVFSLYKKISQLTPRLFGSIFTNDEEIDLFRESIINRLNYNNMDSQSINSISKFLCILVEFQPSFFQLLADIIVKKSLDNKTIYDEGNKSIFKYIFELLDNFNDNKVIFLILINNLIIRYKFVIIFKKFMKLFIIFIIFIIDT